MKKIFTNLFVVLLLACIPVSVSCVSEYDDYNIFATIRGVVLDAESGSPINRAQVSINPTGKVFTTGYDGSFLFSNLDSEQYTITVQKDGYYTNRMNFVAWSNESSEVTIMLDKINY